MYLHADEAPRRVAALHKQHSPWPERAADAWPAWSAEVTQTAATQPAPQPAPVALDLVSVMKAAQAIAGELELEKLLARLMRIALENAGAERGCLILERDGESFVRAAGLADAADIKLHDAIPLSEARNLPASIINYVRRTQESIVLADAPRDDRYGTDPYIAERQPRSVMCIPALNQGRLTGVLYLENNQAAGAFTPERTLICQLLAAQAAISLENVWLYDEMKSALAEVERLRNRLHAENIYLQEEIRREHNFDEIVGSSPALLAVLQQVERVAPTDVTVLILGETGTGKELIARAIHDRSPRKNRPLVKVNCGAISAGLVESELFGHVKGAFTGALDKRTGRFELADGGTIFLDEVGELPLETQVKLLRVLQEGEFEPVGSSRTSRVDVRIIAATNRHLADEVKAGRFRADLYYRLNVLPLHNPPLRERREDLPSLAMFFLARQARRFGRQFDGIAQATIELMMNYDWPGNIRELQNMIERAVVLSTGPTLMIDRRLLLPPVAVAAPETQPHPVTASAPVAATALDEVQRQHILSVLAQTGWVIEGAHGAARKLNLHPNTLRSRLKKMGIQRPGA